MRSAPPELRVSLAEAIEELKRITEYLEDSLAAVEAAHTERNGDDNDV